MKSVIACALVSVVLLGCEQSKVEYGPMLREVVEVADVVYSPPRHGDAIGMGVGMTSNGQMATTIVPVSVDIPEKYAVVFRCAHGKFIVEGKELWDVLKEGQNGTAIYSEKIRSVYEDKKLKRKELVGYHLWNVEINGRKVLAKDRP